MIEELDRWGVKFEKDETGDYAVRKVHHLGTYVLPMPEGPPHEEASCTGSSRSARVEIVNRVVGTRMLTGRAKARPPALMGFDCRTADFVRDPRQAR